MDITHAGLTVVDLQASLWFYRDLLGMEVVQEYTSQAEVARLMWKAPGLEKLENAMIRWPGSLQELQLTQACGDFGDRREHLVADPWDIGAACLSLPVADLEPLVGRLAGNGFTPLAGGLVDDGHGLSAAVFADPNGVFVELVQGGNSIDNDRVHTSIVVSDLERSVSFYRDDLGLELLSRSAGDVAFVRRLLASPDLESIESARLKMPGFNLQLQLNEMRGAAQRDLEGHQWDVGFAHVCYTLDDLDALFDVLAGRGVEPKAVVRGLIDSWVTGSHVPDPDGFDLELLQVL